MARIRSALVTLVLIAPLLLAACGHKTAVDTMDDAMITARVKTAFINDPVVGNARIDVGTVKGVVTLSGRVPNKDDEAKAIALARAVKGVAEVKSTLQIQP